MLPSDRLRDKLIVANNKPFQAYQDLVGAYRFDRFVLYLDAIQPDPMAGPSRGRVRIDQAEAQLPPALWSTPPRKTALEDFLARALAEAIRRHVRTRWTGRTPPLAVDAGSQTVLRRAACTIAEDWVEVRVAIGLPAEGRKAAARAAITLFFEELPAVVEAGLVWARLDGEAGRRFVETVEDYLALQAQLPALGLVAFLADGAVLPRETPPGDGPLRGGRAQPLQAPDALAVTVSLPHRGTVRGLGIPRGVTVVTGGAFSGKSTLLAAVARGVYPHVPGDGRELVATVPDAVMVRAEPGRRIERVDLSAMVHRVPGRPEVSAFSAERASGALSVVASLAEALEVGTSLFVFDEDDLPAALLTRDARMEALVPPADDPLTRLVDVVRPLWEDLEISSIVATAGLGDFLAVADTVLVMDAFQPRAATAAAQQAVALGAPRAARRATVAVPAPRCPLPRGFNGLRGRRIASEMRGRGALVVGRESVDLAGLPQLVEPGQARAAGDAILYAVEKGYIDGAASIAEILARVFADLEAGGLLLLSEGERGSGDYALPRPYEVAAVLNRLRALQVRVRRPGQPLDLDAARSQPQEAPAPPTPSAAEEAPSASGPEAPGAPAAADVALVRLGPEGPAAGADASGPNPTPHSADAPHDPPRP
ncbi:MAG: ABC-ATPase domain-containing protein [Armatimonadota bacterium]|nr:ABC-ATPase domain-containing protein [Armatimonadota bacterium]